MTLPLSTFIITLNEADRIGRAIESVRGLADEIIVVDSGSTDGTQDVARALGARILTNAWEGYGAQKRFGEAQCKHHWILNIDADEAISQELAVEIRTLFAAGAPDKAAYILGMQDILPGQDRSSRFNYVKWHIRLYDKSRAGFNTSTVHDVVEVKQGGVGRLSQAVLHYSTRSVAHSIDKLNRYSSMQADNMAASGKRIPLLPLKLVLIFPLSFFKSYVLRKNAMLGTAGFINSVMYAFSRFARLAKMWEMTREE